MKKCQKPGASSRKLRQNIGAPDFGAKGVAGKKTYI